MLAPAVRICRVRALKEGKYQLSIAIFDVRDGTPTLSLLKVPLLSFMFQVGQESCSGQCIPVQCDHGNDEEVQKVFDKVSKEQNGRLDILVNNACTGWKVGCVSSSSCIG